MNQLNKSHIELLPDELWLQVFAYSHLFDLYDAWRNLNSHIDAILRSVHIGIHIKSQSNNDIHYKNALAHFSLQTVYVKDERWDASTSRRPWSIDLLSLVNIRSLYLAHSSQEQFKQLANQHQLTRLSLPCDHSSLNFFEQYVLGEEGEERFPQLRSIGRIWCDYGATRNSYPITVNTKIRHVDLIVPSCSSDVSFIQRITELSSITVDYLGNESGFQSSCFISAKIRRGRGDSSSKILSKKDSSSQNVDQKKLSLLTMAPRIYFLQINFVGQCDFAKLADILERCSILERLQITVKYYRDNLDLASIRLLSRFFVALTFADVQKETGKPIIVAKWSS